ncbi:MAG: chromophore lyase CpcT/CpeT [Polyangiales bacterium]
MTALRLVCVLGLLGCASAPPPSTTTDAAVGAAADAVTVRDGAVDAAVDVAAPTPDAPVTPDDERVYRALLGRFDSRAQSLRDPRFLAIQLLTCEVAVPALGARVMYVEQARADALNAPYRQRLYVVEAEEGGVRSRVFEFHTPASVVGLCADPSRADVRPEDVIEREGCAVHLRAVDGRFTGGTRGQGCESTLMGARYATSEVELRADGLDSWDRGFNAQGQQVWGSTAGAYRFVRRADTP